MVLHAAFGVKTVANNHITLSSIDRLTVIATSKIFSGSIVCL